MASRAYLLPLAAVLGVAAGVGVGKLGGNTAAAASTAPPEATTAATPSKRDPKPGSTHSPAQAKLTLVKPGPLPKSTDTVETLLQLDRGPLYARLGLWLLDASEEDMNAFWEGYHEREDPNDTIKDLLFTQWGKKNAAGMLACARRTGCEVSAMWSWSMSDPEGMLAYVKGKDPRMANYGLRGLAYFHPELARQMLEDDPSLANTFEMEQLAEMLCKGDPKAEMDFMAKYRNDEYFGRQSLKKWAAQDPHRAFEWLTDHGGDAFARQEFFETVMREHPEVLPELAATLPNGTMRRQIESAAFSQLAETDPDKALEEASKIEVPRLAAERLSVLGRILAGEDPARAFEVLGELFTKCPDVANRMSWTRYPDGSGSGGGGVVGFQEFVQALATKEPAQTMQTLLDLEARAPAEANGGPYGQSNLAAYQVARTWAAKDLESFTSWTESQQTPELRDMGASFASEQLMGRNDYSGAAAWALRLSKVEAQTNALVSVVSTWGVVDRAAAQRWFEETQLPEKTRQHLSPYFPANQEHE